MVLNSFLCPVHYCPSVQQDLNYREAQWCFYFLTTFIPPEWGFKPTEALIGWDSYRNQTEVSFSVWSHVLFLSESEINQIQFFSFIMADWADSRDCCVFVVSGSSRCLLGFVVGFTADVRPDGPTDCPEVAGALLLHAVETLASNLSSLFQHRFNFSDRTN